MTKVPSTPVPGADEEDLLRAGLDVLLGELGLGEEAGRLDDDVDTQLAPREVGGVALREGLDRLAVDGDAVVVVADLGVEDAADRVVLQQVRQSLVVGEVVDRDDLKVCSLRESRAEVVASDAAEAVDTDLDRHSGLPVSRAPHAAFQHAYGAGFFG